MDRPLHLGLNVEPSELTSRDVKVTSHDTKLLSVKQSYSRDTKLLLATQSYFLVCASFLLREVTLCRRK
jgi:hypothetical protein